MITNEEIRLASQACVNSYEGRHGLVDWSPFIRHEKHDSGRFRWFEACRGRQLWIIITGTHNSEGWEDNLDYQQIPVELPGGHEIMLNKGFYRDEWLLAEDDILSLLQDWGGEVVFCGHSQGGATAPIGAMVAACARKFLDADFCGPIKCIAEAGPRFTDPAGARFYRSLGIETVLLWYRWDPVPMLPPWLIPGLVKRRRKFFCFNYWPSLLRYKHVGKISQLGRRDIISFFWKVGKTYNELKMLFHDPADYLDAVKNKYDTE